MSKPEDVYFTRKMVRKIRGKKEPIVIEVPDKYTPAQKKGMRGIKKIEERDPLSLNYLKKKPSSGTTRQKLKEANLMLQKRGKDISDILVKKRKQAEERKAKEVVLPPEFIKLIESLKPGAKKLTPQELQKQEQERRDGFDYFNKVFDRIANEKLPKTIIPSFRMQFINLQSNKEKIDFLKGLLNSKDLKKLYLSDEEFAQLKRDKENRERREKGLPPLEDIEDIPPLAPITDTDDLEPAQARRRRRARVGLSSASETEESEPARPRRFARPPRRGRFPSPTESDRERLGLNEPNIGRTRGNILRETLITQAERAGLPPPSDSDDFFSQSPSEGELAIPNLEDIDLPVGTMVGEGLMLKRGRGRPRKHPIKGAGFFDTVGDLVKKGISAGIDYVKKDPIGTAKKAYEYGKKGFELYKSRKEKKTEEKGGALLTKPTRGHSTYQSYF